MKGLRYGMVAWTIALFCVSLPSAALDPAACDAKFQTGEGGMVGYWTFDDPADPTKADYGKFNAANNGAIWTPNGVAGGAFYYDAYSGSRKKPPLSLETKPGKGITATYAVWFRHTGDEPLEVGTHRLLQNQYDPGNASLTVGKKPDGTSWINFLACEPVPPNQKPSCVSLSATDETHDYLWDNRWHQATVVVRGKKITTFELWLDGSLQSERTLQLPSWLPPTDIAVGAVRELGNWLAFVDEIAVFHRPLTSDEVLDLYASSSAGSGYCGRTVELDGNAQSLGATVDIRYGPAGLGDGDTFDAGAAYQYRVNIGGFSGGWLTGPSTPVLEIDENDEYAVQTMAMDVTLPWTTSVDIRFGTDNDGLLEGGSFAVPMGDYQYRVNACGLTGPWKDFSVAASGDLVVYSGSDVAEIGVVSSDPTITVDVRYGEDNDGLMDGDRFCAPSPTTVQYRVGAGGYSGNWLDLEIAGDEVLLVTEGDQYATVTVLDVPTGGAVDIRYGEANDGLGNGATFLSPNMQDRQWRLCVSGHCSGWIDYTVSSPYQLSVSEGQAYAEIGIDLSTAMGLSGAALYVADPSARIDIRYGVSDLPHDAIVTLPCTTVQWRLKTEGGSLKGPWTSHDVCGVGDIVPIAGADAMELQFNFDWTTSKYAKTAVRYVRTVTNCNDTGTHCERLVAPCGTNVQARPDLGNISPPWLAAPVDCGWDTWTWHMGAETTDGAPQ